MANKRPNGEGSFYFDEKKQLYRGMVTTPAGRRLTKSSKSEEVVKDWLNEQRFLVGRNQHIEPTGISLGQWLRLWVNNYSKPNVRQRTFESNQTSICHFDPIGNIPLTKLTPLNIQALYNDLQEEGYSTASISRYHSVLVSALKQAVINKHLHTNIAQLVKPPKIISDEIVVFTQKEIDLLLDVAKPSHYYVALLLAVTTGMRRGEILGIRWRDIDLDKKILYVRQNLQETKIKGIIFEPPKTSAGKRKIPLPSETVEALNKYKEKEDSIKSKKTDLVFTTKKYTPISPRNFSQRFWERLQMLAEFHQNNFKAHPQSVKKTYEEILEECRLKEDWIPFEVRNFHALRHTYATTLLSKGVPVADVSKVLGHAKVSTTYDIYSHAIPENLDMIANKIAEFLTK